MRFLRFARRAATLLAATLGLALGAQAQSMPAAEAPPAAKSLEVQMFKATPGSIPAAYVRLEAPEPGAIEAVKRSNSTERLKPLQIGIGRELDAAGSSGAAPRWSRVADGFAAHWQVTSAEARALRVAMQINQAPASAEVRFAGSARMDVVYGPFTASNIAQVGPVYWSPVLEGTTATLEIFVRGDALPQLELSLPRLSHLFVSPAQSNIESEAKAAGACEVDFVCRAATDNALEQTGRAVARMTFTTSDGGSSLCTGTLLNPSDASFAPYFLSAAHCISTTASARTLTTHWFYERTGCRIGVTSPSNVQMTGGATLLFVNETSDVSFMRLNGTLPANVTFAGWDATPVAVGTPVTAIHHPQGDLKKVSVGSVNSYGPSGLSALGNFMRVSWNSIATGVVEPGSSGGGIFSGNSSAGYRLRGGLLGGPSSCTATAGELYDEYSRLDQAYGFIAQYLDPANQPAPGPNVVANPGFESGANSWSQTGGKVAIITSDAASARSGSWYAWLGGAVSVTDVLHQDLIVPGGQARLQFWYRINTAETSASIAYDTMTVALVDPSTGATLQTVASFSNLDAAGEWAPSPIFDLSAFSGAAVRLRLTAVNDFSDTTSFRLDDVMVSGTSSASANNYTALWWDPDESGWGINVNHQGDIAFATLFTYDAAGAPLWLVMSAGARQGDSDTFAGDLYRTRGPVFNAVPFTPINAGDVTRVGSMTLAFSGNAGTLAYDVNGTSVVKSIQKQVFGSSAAKCLVTTRGRSGAANYQDLWWNPNESGWGLNLTQQGQTLFGTLFTYGTNNQGLWLVMSGGVRQVDGSYLGDLYRTSGPPFDAVPFTPIGPANLTRVGAMRLRFQGGEAGSLEYTVDGQSVTKAIIRQVFSNPVPVCSD